MELSENRSEFTGVEVRTTFVRYRNVLLAEADFTGLFVDYYLHLVDHGLQIAREFDDVFKNGLAAFTLHCASRPRNEMTAWTINFQEPLVNLFLAGDNNPSTVTGRIFSENVREADQGLFYSDVVRNGTPPHRSAISFATIRRWNDREATFSIANEEVNLANMEIRLFRQALWAKE